MEIDINKLTLADVEMVEEMTGRGIDDLFPDGQPKAKSMRALYFVVARKTNPDLTYESTGLISISEMSEALNPTIAAQAP